MIDDFPNVTTWSIDQENKVEPLGTDDRNYCLNNKSRISLFYSYLLFSS